MHEATGRKTEEEEEEEEEKEEGGGGGGGGEHRVEVKRKSIKSSIIIRNNYIKHRQTVAEGKFFSVNSCIPPSINLRKEWDKKRGNIKG